MKRLNISQIDTLFANGSYPIEFLFYYKDRLKTERIRSALSDLSPVFWPLFGEYDTGVIHFDKYDEEDCFDEDVIDQAFDREETTKNIYDKYCRISPSNLKKLFFLTIVQCSNGTLLIPKMNHLAGDGYSYFLFLSTLAAVCRDAELPSERNPIGPPDEPHHQRTVLKEFQFNDMGLESLPDDKEGLTIEFQEIPKKQVRHLINAVASGLHERVSTNDILSAMVIKRLGAIPKESFGDDFQLTIPIDVRRQVKEYGPRYFGNGLMVHAVTFKKIEVEKSGVCKLAIEIRKSMPTITKESYLEYLGTIEASIARRQTNRLRVFDPRTGCLVTNLSLLPANRLDFGTGNPDFTFPLTIERNSAGILSDEENFVTRLAY